MSMIIIETEAFMAECDRYCRGAIEAMLAGYQLGSLARLDGAALAARRSKDPRMTEAHQLVIDRIVHLLDTARDLVLRRDFTGVSEVNDALDQLVTLRAECTVSGSLAGMSQ